MEKNNGRTATSSQQASQFRCSGNCLNCLPAQRAYCASQHSYSNMKVLDAMMGEVLIMKEEVRALAEKLEAMQVSEGAVFDVAVRDNVEDNIER